MVFNFFLKAATGKHNCIPFISMIKLWGYELWHTFVTIVIKKIYHLFKKKSRIYVKFNTAPLPDLQLFAFIWNGKQTSTVYAFKITCSQMKGRVCIFFFAAQHLWMFGCFFHISTSYTFQPLVSVNNMNELQLEEINLIYWFQVLSLILLTPIPEHTF